MDQLSFFHRLFDYDYWANREVLASVSALAEPAEKPRRILSHIIGAQRIWLARFESPNPPGPEPWPTLTFEQFRPSVDELHQRWVQLLGSFTADKLAQDLLYLNTKGMEFRNPIQDVLMHLVVHSAYHRGQVAAAIREAGGKPAPTDYVVYVRQAQKT